MAVTAGEARSAFHERARRRPPPPPRRWRGAVPLPLAGEEWDLLLGRETDPSHSSPARGRWRRVAVTEGAVRASFHGRARAAPHFHHVAGAAWFREDNGRLVGSPFIPSPPLPVIPANAGTHGCETMVARASAALSCPWVPAFAGMTDQCRRATFVPTNRIAETLRGPPCGEAWDLLPGAETDSSHSSPARGRWRRVAVTEGEVRSAFDGRARRPPYFHHVAGAARFREDNGRLVGSPSVPSPPLPRHPGERRDPWMRDDGGARISSVILSMGPGVRPDDGSVRGGQHSSRQTDRRNVTLSPLRGGMGFVAREGNRAFPFLPRKGEVAPLGGDEGEAGSARNQDVRCLLPWPGAETGWRMVGEGVGT
jgi:hypothetical protein